MIASPPGTPQQPARAPVSGPRTARRNAVAARLSASTPRRIALLMVVLVLLSVGWGALGAWTAGLHASAAAGVVATSEPLSVQARQMYQSLSDADVTATTAFLAGPAEPLAARQRYQSDIALAGADLAALRNAAPGRSPLAAGLTAVSAGLPVYTGYVAQAQADSTLGFPLAGGSFMQVASEQMHLTLLPAARAIYAQEGVRLDARSAQATGLPWIVAALAFSVLLGVLLVRSQHWLTRRTRRIVNYGLLAATVLMTVVSLWLLVAFAIARADLQRAEAHGSVPAQELAQAAITVQRARGDEVLNLISRSGSTSFQGDFTAARHQVGPGPGSLLSAAAAATSGGTTAAAAVPVAAAIRDAQSWYAASGRVFSLDVAANYAAETQLVIGSGAGSSAAGFTRLEQDLDQAISSDQAVFSAGARSASSAFDGLAIAFIVAAVLMAAGGAWGLSQRLAEYQ